jgi:2,4-dienoyl-CoA reductase-like NADH-dependent reductase (Old Yellow Enzyme family)
LSEYVRHHADIMTMAVGLIIQGDQAEQILRDKQADLITPGREILNNPNWPMDAALKLGVEGPFRNVSPQFLAIGWAPVPSAGSVPCRRLDRTGSTSPARYPEIVS